MLDDLIATDKEWRLNQTKLNELRHQRKEITIEIAKLKKAGKEADAEVSKAQDIDVTIKEMEKKTNQQEEKIHEYLLNLPNLLDETVPLGKDSNDNVEVKKWGNIRTFDFPVKKPYRFGFGFRPS